MNDETAGDDDDAIYQIGYKRPPKEHQFKKGRSGNPRGRPKGAKGFAALVRENLARTVQVRMDGHTRTVSVGEAILMRTLRDAVSGGKRAAEQGLKLMERFGTPEPEEAELVWSLENLSDDELTELERLSCKATGKLDEFAEFEADRRRERQEARAERIRIFGPNILPEEDDN
ncbi:DUF5681 domain-containing protein [Sphingomonas sp. Leaf33]|uniref:DUF5681 domain-containing protein n=1 Tax=Sphingomonas sp. Leaf33 TaxID=1736215 RepID=UPI000AC1C1E9|nr:DUF5681 domain-containing protein [Sphingomonas sp. Leaf33]